MQTFRDFLSVSVCYSPYYEEPCAETTYLDLEEAPHSEYVGPTQPLPLSVFPNPEPDHSTAETHFLPMSGTGNAPSHLGVPQQRPLPAFLPRE
jgi:hypothetical protein